MLLSFYLISNDIVDSYNMAEDKNREMVEDKKIPFQCKPL